MAGGIYVSICLSFAIAGGIVGRLKGSSFVIWAIISGVVPVLGLLCAVLYRFEDDEPRQRCPSCGRVCMAYDALCVRCGNELDFGDAELLAPPSHSV